MEKRYSLAIRNTDPITDPAAVKLHTEDAWELSKLRSKAKAIAKPGMYVEITDRQGSNGEAWTVPAAEDNTETAKEDQAMNTTETPARRYYADHIETAGRTYPCSYSYDGDTIIATIDNGGAPLAVVIPADHPDHPAAEIAAICPPVTDPIYPAEADEQPVPEEVPAPVDEQPAPAAPIVKPWAGETIQGNGWRIVFDASTARTRVIFDAQPAEEVKKAVADAGFYWSAVMQSYNKHLTAKARRKAEQLAVTLAAMMPAAV